MRVKSDREDAAVLFRETCGKVHQPSPLVLYAAVLNDEPQRKLLAFALRCSSATLEGIFCDRADHGQGG
jgi:hypothetical protein